VSALVVTIHALLLAQAEIQRDRDSLFESAVNQSTGVVEDQSDAVAIAGYDRTLALIDEALEQAKRDPVPLRDYFAAKAMQAAATNPKGADGFTFAQRADWAYQQADAMLKARQQ
jgi:hypothetical protein